MLRNGLQIIGLAALCATGSVAAQARDLTIVSFGGSLQDAVRAAFIKPFSASTGKPFAEDTYDGSLSQIAAQIQAKALKWDVVDLESNDLIQGCQEGDFERLDWSNFKDKADLIPAAVNTSPCGAGYLTGAMVLSYDTTKLANGPKSWADFWDVAKFPGKRGLRFGPKWTLEVALMADGVPPAQVYAVLAGPGGVDRAFHRLDELKPYISWWKLGAESIQMLASGDVAMVAAYNGRIVAADRGEGRKFAMVWEAGSISFMDYWAILAGSPNRTAAQDFIDFALSPDPQRAFPNSIGYGPTNLAAFKGMKPEIASELPTEERLQASTFRDDKFWLDHGDELTERFNVWVAK